MKTFHISGKSESSPCRHIRAERRKREIIRNKNVHTGKRDKSDNVGDYFQSPVFEKRFYKRQKGKKHAADAAYRKAGKKYEYLVFSDEHLFENPFENRRFFSVVFNLVKNSVR